MEGFRLLTNAPFLMPLGKRCDNSHDHTRLQGKFTSMSSAYNWTFCISYAWELKKAPRWLKLAHMQMPVHFMSRKGISACASQLDPTDYTSSTCLVTVPSVELTRRWPSFPLTYTCGEFDDERRVSVTVGDEPVIAPLRVDPEHNPAAAAEHEEEFALLLRWLCELKIPATKVTHELRRDGEEVFIVYFAAPVFDVRDLREKSSLHFQAYGRHHARKWGIEKASAMAFAAYSASHLDNPKSQFGCGTIKWNGHHGNESNEFWWYPVSTFAYKPNFDPMCETFAIPEAFCWNCSEIYRCDDWKHYKMSWSFCWLARQSQTSTNSICR